MSKLEELIQQYCPDGVEYKMIGELSSFRRGSFPQPYGNKEWYDGNESMPFVQVADIGNNLKLVATTKRRISKKAQPMSVFAPKGSIIISIQGSIGRIAITQYDAYIDRTIAIFNDLSNEIEPKYFVYQLQRVFDIKEKTARGSTIKTITKEEFTNFEIPVPALPVQREIVQILDKFSLLSAELAAELAAELPARQQQYEYYKEQLLNTNTDIKKLNEVAEITDSLHATPSYVEEGYPMIRVADVKEGYVDIEKALKVDEETYNTFIKRYKPQYNDIIVSRVGSFGNFSLVPDKEVCLGQNVALIHPIINNKYLYYYLRSKAVLDYVNKNARGGGYKNIGIKDILEIPIRVPSAKEQERVAQILENFDSLINSIIEGLPAEIEARQKQYEYYRDKLLTFERKVIQ